MSKSLNIQTNDFDGWFDTVNLNMEFWESPVRAARFGYEAGQQSRQEEIDVLQKRIKELELINFDSELHFDAAKEHIDLLQKRIDEIDNHVGVNYDCERDDDQHSYWSGYNQALKEIFEMLKGDDND